MIIGKAGELGDQPGHQVDADHRHFALGGSAQERPPALRIAVEDGHPQSAAGAARMPPPAATRSR